MSESQCHVNTTTGKDHPLSSQRMLLVHPTLTERCRVGPEHEPNTAHCRTHAPFGNLAITWREYSASEVIMIPRT